MKIEPRFNGSMQEIKCGLCGEILYTYPDYNLYDLTESGKSAEIIYDHLVKECAKTAE